MGEGQNGRARYGGTPFELTTGVVVTIPEFDLDEIERFEALGRALATATPGEHLRLVMEEVEVIYDATARNHPDLTLEEFRKGIAYRHLDRLFDAVNELNGLVSANPQTAAPAPT